MFVNPRSNTTPWAAAIFALLGLLWCGYVAFPTSSPCTTAGCALYQDTKVFGISMWALGGAAFLVLAFLCLRGYRFLAWHLARLCLAIDCFLLILMSFTATCVYCLVVAALFALIFFSLRKTVNARSNEAVRFSILLPFWFGLFLSNTVLVLDEVADRWSIAGPENAQVTVFFSPSCEYCHNALLETEGKARLLPVIKDEGDLEAILRLEKLLAQGVPMREALIRSKSDQEMKPEISLTARMLLAVQLQRNKAYVFKHGNGVLPLVIIEGGPSGDSLGKQRPASTDASTESPPAGQRENAPGQPLNTTAPPPFDGPVSGAENQENPALPFEVDQLGNCPDGATEPCD